MSPTGMVPPPNPLCIKGGGGGVMGVDMADIPGGRLRRRQKNHWIRLRQIKMIW